MTSGSLKSQVVSPKSVRLVAVESKSFGLGLKNPPPLEVELSNGNLLRITIDDVYGVTSFRLFRGSGDVIGNEAFPWQTGIDGEILDGLLDEVRESNRRWWAEHESSDIGKGVDE